jgi:hypothetical protein
MASMFTHINVEKDVKTGIEMMKYAINHREHFVNVYPPFLFGLLQCIISLIVEINVMIVLTSIPDVVGVIIKYVSLCAIASIPRFYFASLTSEHKMTICSSMKLKIVNYRHMNPLEGAHWSLFILRFINKFFRLIYTTWTYYFMPFTAIFLNFQFMVYEEPGENDDLNQKKIPVIL